MIALCGVIVPLLGGFGVAWFFNRPDMIDVYKRQGNEEEDVK